jgi:DNA helicase HerA-like ATPase
VTQNPLDVPETVLAQLGNRVQHALRAFTPRDQKAVRAAAETFRPNKDLDTAQVITELGKGEALVSFLEGNGTPSMVERTMIRPPSARIGPCTPDERKATIRTSPVQGKYDTAVDSESAYEILQKRVKDNAGAAGTPGLPAPGAPGQPEQPVGFWARLGAWFSNLFGMNRGRSPLTPSQRIAREITRTVANRIAGQVAANVGKSLGGSVGGSVGRAIVRGTLGGILRR